MTITRAHYNGLVIRKRSLDEHDYKAEVPRPALPEPTNHHPQGMPGDGMGRSVEMMLRKKIADMPLKRVRIGTPGPKDGVRKMRSVQVRTPGARKASD